MAQTTYDNHTHAAHFPPWSLLAISGSGMLNAGNRLVELSLLANLPNPELRFSVFESPNRGKINSLKRHGCSLVICSGTTLLTEKNSCFWEWATQLTEVGIPCAMIGGCFWNPTRDGSDRLPGNTAVLSVRDPYSRRICEQQGVRVPMVACPSLLLGQLEQASTVGEWILVGFHRVEFELQIAWFAALASRLQRPIRILVQERHENKLARQLVGQCDGEIIPLVELESLADWNSVFEGVRLCISGRLHQVLPASAMCIPSLLAVPNETARLDSRLSLLTHLNVPVELMGAEAASELRAAVSDHQAVDELVARLRCFISELCTSSPLHR